MFRKKKKQWWICKCGNIPNTNGYEGFYNCDHVGYPDEESLHFACARCGDIQRSFRLAHENRHPEAPQKPIDFIEYLEIKKRQEKLAYIKAQQKDEPEQER
ncbi:MAG: hypothetical protein GKR88_02190 [Flavobacteriaceae bacterium]|nr:MAG: hypothetical protein GKR88_02190 [Flavobacteriaceae bacterium]